MKPATDCMNPEHATAGGSSLASLPESLLYSPDARPNVEEILQIGAGEKAHRIRHLTSRASVDTVESMNDSGWSFSQEDATRPRWLLFIHQLPPKPDYLRVKVRRRLKGIGAVAVKQTVYLLPNTSESLEDFHWLREEIESEGGTAIIVEAAFVEGLSDEEVEAMLETFDESSGAHSDRRTEADRVGPGQTWVTREDVHVDRIASAWLIRRFIDPQAQFKFVPARGYKRRPSELRFDMFEAEYTHVGEECTFQTLVKRFGLVDQSLTTIGEIIHDIDCKDERFGRPETPGIASLIQGIARRYHDDTERISRGSALLEDLYASFKKRRIR